MNIFHLLTVALLVGLPATHAFPTKMFPPCVRTSGSSVRLLPPLETEAQTTRTIALWMLAFSSSHIGMSAIRNTLIQEIGKWTDETLNLVNRGWKLPDIWPGDDVGGQEIFPSPDIAGRQIYRVGYTAVSFATLGSAFITYLAWLQSASHTAQWEDSNGLHAIAALAWGCSIASLINPSPLSLVPVYQSTQDTDGAVLVRQDSQKLNAFGMTRITRHPLILPVVPWSMATAFSMGGTPQDFALFGPLAVYAIAGCWAQDLRVTRQEGSVGTVFDPDNSLQDFFQGTSFFPFGAILDGRQSLNTVVSEVPWLTLGAGTAIGYKLQEVLLAWLMNQ